MRSTHLSYQVSSTYLQRIAFITAIVFTLLGHRPSHGKASMNLRFAKSQSLVRDFQVSATKVHRPSHTCCMYSLIREFFVLPYNLCKHGTKTHASRCRHHAFGATNTLVPMRMHAGRQSVCMRYFAMPVHSCPHELVQHIALHLEGLRLPRCALLPPSLPPPLPRP